MLDFAFHHYRRTVGTVRQLGVLLALCAVWLPAAAQTDEAELARAQNWVEQRCHRCHGISGVSSTTAFPKLAGQHREYLVRQMFNFLAGTRPSTVMKEQMEGITGPEIEALAAYFSRQHINPEIVADRAAVARGMVIYHGGGRRNEPGACVSCHGPYARGGQMLPRLAGQHASYLERQLHAFVARTRPSGPPSMHGAVTRLSLAQMRDVSLYLASLE